MKSISYQDFQQNLPYWLAYLHEGGELSVKQAGESSAHSATAKRIKDETLSPSSAREIKKMSFEDALATTRTRHANTIKILGDK